MSHFACLVLVNKDDIKNGVGSVIEGVLSPFSENIEVEEYEQDCYCVNMEATRDAREMAGIECGKTMQELRDKFWDIEESERLEWDDHIKDFSDAEDRLVKEHKLYNKPKEDCEECNGTGKRMTTYNPDSKWDWYQTGGRWTGYYSDYDPSTDPKNIEVCSLCDGTGMRAGWAWIDADGAHYKDDWAKECGGCNGCKGTGNSVKDRKSVV